MLASASDLPEAMSDTELPAFRVNVLGPLALTVDDHDVDVPGAKRRATLALLALADGATVPSTDLVDAVWPDNPPKRARQALQSHVSRIRGHLDAAGERLEVVERGYRLRLRHGEVDVHLARDGLELAHRIAEDDPGGAAEQLVAVRQLWRGPVLAEFDGLLAIESQRFALDDLCEEVDALLVRCALRAGDIDRALRSAASATAAHPGSEASIRLRMQALAAAGRPAEALRFAAEFRRRMRDELGVEPTATLGELEREIATGNTLLDLHRSAAGTATRLVASIPLPTSAIIGREAEVAAARRLLDNERVVTVVGVGGVGKTRLAADLARRFDGDAHWVALAPLTDPAELPRVLAAALGLERTRGDVLDACTQLLGAGDDLLVLDNCEHVLEHARIVVTRLLRSCPTLTVLTTSRQRLGLAEECTFRLGPLAVPDPTAAHPERSPAVAVFLDRAQRVRPGFEPSSQDLADAIAIVRRLDGVPLAIELAAGRLSFLDIHDLRDRLDRALDLLRGGRRSARHQTLRGTLDWSYDLLPPDRRRLFRHLAVFPDGVDLTTAERVADEVGVDDDPVAALGHLVDASMLDADLDNEARYRMLETVRAFALERLDASSERDAAETRLLRWAAKRLAWIDDTLHTADEARADACLRRELANFRGAWTLAMRRGELDIAVDMIVSLDDAAQWRELPEVWSWAQTIADDDRLASSPRRAAALATASDFAWLQGDLARATELAESARACATDDEGRGRALLSASVTRLSQGDFRSAADLALAAGESTARPEHSKLVAALATAYLGDLEAAEAINTPARPAAGITQQAEWEYTAAELASIAGRYDEAEGHYRRARELAHEVGSSFVAGLASVGLLTIFRSTGRHHEALRGYRDVLGYWQRAGNWIQVWITVRNVAELLIELDDTETANTLLMAAERAPGAPAVGDSAWDQTIVEPGGAAAGPTRQRDDVVELALAAIERHISLEPAPGALGGTS